jgi:hypothetical protein
MRELNLGSFGPGMEPELEASSDLPECLLASCCAGELNCHWQCQRFKVHALFKSTSSKIHPGRSGVASIPKEPKARP